jgi:hypothetical protein
MAMGCGVVVSVLGVWGSRYVSPAHLSAATTGIAAGSAQHPFLARLLRAAAEFIMAALPLALAGALMSWSLERLITEAGESVWWLRARRLLTALFLVASLAVVSMWAYEQWDRPHGWRIGPVWRWLAILALAGYTLLWRRLRWREFRHDIVRMFQRAYREEKNYGSWTAGGYFANTLAGAPHTRDLWLQAVADLTNELSGQRLCDCAHLWVAAAMAGYVEPRAHDLLQDKIDALRASGSSEAGTAWTIQALSEELRVFDEVCQERRSR